MDDKSNKHVTISKSNIHTVISFDAYTYLIKYLEIISPLQYATKLTVDQSFARTVPSIACYQFGRYHILLIQHHTPAVETSSSSSSSPSSAAAAAASDYQQRVHVFRVVVCVCVRAQQSCQKRLHAASSRRNGRQRR